MDGPSPGPLPPASPWRRTAALAALALAVAACWWGFRAAGLDYWRFWLDAGPVIGLATGALGWAWGGMDRNPGLVSADPSDYAGAALQVAGLPLMAFGGHLQRGKGGGGTALDSLAILPLALVFAAGILGWLVLIAPAQYFAFLLFGAPSRIALASRYRLRARVVGRHLDVVETPGDELSAEDRGAGWWDASMRDSPVTVASAFMAAGLVAIGWALGIS